jgi:hypothetical protein
MSEVQIDHAQLPKASAFNSVWRINSDLECTAVSHIHASTQHQPSLHDSVNRCQEEQRPFSCEVGKSQTVWLDMLLT